MSLGKTVDRNRTSAVQTVGIWNEWAVTSYKYYPRIQLKKLGKAAEASASSVMATDDIGIEAYREVQWDFEGTGGRGGRCRHFQGRNVGIRFPRNGDSRLRLRGAQGSKFCSRGDSETSLGIGTPQSVV